MNIDHEMGMDHRLVCWKTVKSGLKCRSAWIYFYPLPKYKTLGLYSQAMLSNMVSKLLKEVAIYRVKSLGFANFEWQGLDGNSYCGLFFR